MVPACHVDSTVKYTRIPSSSISKSQGSGRVALCEFGEKMVQQAKEPCKFQSHLVLLLPSGPAEAKAIYKAST